jgi:hypothetical protein
VTAGVRVEVQCATCPNRLLTLQVRDGQVFVEDRVGVALEGYQVRLVCPSCSNSPDVRRGGKEQIVTEAEVRKALRKSAGKQSRSGARIKALPAGDIVHNLRAERTIITDKDRAQR